MPCGFGSAGKRHESHRRGQGLRVPQRRGLSAVLRVLTVDGVGDLYVAFEQLKKKLAAQGLFDPAHKKPLPRYPGRIGIITSSAGAAVHDMLRILNKRYPLSKVYLLPVRVQGAQAPGEIVSAIRYANYYQLADLLIVGRGGGSIEDLWAFNDEQVALAIYHSQIPVISAVGHEPDVTISDYVADLRAANPLPMRRSWRFLTRMLCAKAWTLRSAPWLRL